mmetsp:Transcript_13077/g.52375  ORF Transcript_13077/g.52375 Transcript_13077/m.52375 type:complete len:258 (-) Transcript_13077:1528-2301(-)
MPSPGASSCAPAQSSWPWMSMARSCEAALPPAFARSEQPTYAPKLPEKARWKRPGSTAGGAGSGRPCAHADPSSSSSAAAPSGRFLTTLTVCSVGSSAVFASAYLRIVSASDRRSSARRSIASVMSRPSSRWRSTRMFVSTSSTRPQCSASFFSRRYSRSDHWAISSRATAAAMAAPSRGFALVAAGRLRQTPCVPLASCLTMSTASCQAAMDFWRASRKSLSFSERTLGSTTRRPDASSEPLLEMRSISSAMNRVA